MSREKPSWGSRGKHMTSMPPALLLLSTMELPRLEQMDIKPCLPYLTDPRGRWVPTLSYMEDPPHMSGVTRSGSVLIPTFHRLFPFRQHEQRESRSVLPPTCHLHFAYPSRSTSDTTTAFSRPRNLSRLPQPRENIPHTKAFPPSPVS